MVAIRRSKFSKSVTPKVKSSGKNIYRRNKTCAADKPPGGRVMRIFTAKSVVTALLLALWLGVIALNWPGHFSTDSVIQLLEGRTGHYETWHPPVMSLLLGLADAVTPGAGLFAAFDATLLFGSLLLLVRVRDQVSWWAIPVLAACALTPQFLLYPGLVWKDVLFAHASVAGFACLAFAGGRWERRDLRVAFAAL